VVAVDDPRHPPQYREGLSRGGRRALRAIIEGTTGEIGEVRLVGDVAVPDDRAMQLLDDVPVRDPEDPEGEVTYADGRRYLEGLAITWNGTYSWVRLEED
jgi:hypothetical protein